MKIYQSAWMRGGVIAILATAGFIAAGCDRNDMHNGFQMKPYEESTFFADGMSSRPLVEGTVPRGVPGLEIPYAADPSGGTLINAAEPGGPPQQISAALLQRGRERFNIYCSVCHNYTGDGNGMIVQRGFTKPPSFHEQRLRDLPMSHYYDVMTKGYGAMYSYADRVPPSDRWAIAAYVRVLQVSHNPQAYGLPAPEGPLPKATGEGHSAMSASEPKSHE